MIRPASFGYNEQTANSNSFQKNDQSLNVEVVKQKAVEEFDAFVKVLRAKGINVHVFEDDIEPPKSDAVFPNNWVSFHQNGTVITYPMYAPSRRSEQRTEILDALGANFSIAKRLHFEYFEFQNKFLEGTGSMILDRVNKIVYACISPRTDASLIDEYCLLMGYEKVQFRSVDAAGKDIYHTNVMMALAESFAVICLESIKDTQERTAILQAFAKTGKEVVEISFDQVLAFAGNMLQVRNDKGQTFMVMSEQAFRSLDASQIEQISRHTEIVHSPIEIIETYGGGSARCMMAEIFLPTVSAS